MIWDKYSALLSELGKALHLPIEGAKQGACLFKLKDNITIAIEADAPQENVLIVIEIGSIPSGPYRQKIFQEALKANGLPPPRNGIFAYSSKKDELLLYDQIPLENLNIPELLSFLKTLLQKARRWKTSIEQNEVPSYASTEETFGSMTSSSHRGKGMFGL